MLLIIDNYDSFTYNLVQYVGELGFDSEICRNDKIGLDEISKKSPDKIIISPGPCTPEKAGISVELIKQYAPTIPILGVCLGHQCIGQAYGAVVDRAPVLMHGKTSEIRHFDDLIFKGVSNPFVATRYHSLVILPSTLPECLKVTAYSNDDDQIMGVKHKDFNLWGVQFHPESILTKAGKKILDNFLQL